MTYPYLNDVEFLNDLYHQPILDQYVKITILNWMEKPLQEIQTKATGGSINIDGSSAMRRTGSLNMFLDKDEINVLEVEHLLSLNKKIDIAIGYLNNTYKYSEYPILWFPQGRFVITQQSLSHSNSGLDLSLQIKDKMCLLNGEFGGVLAQSVNFSEIYETDAAGYEIITRPTLYQIILEAVNHFGGEQVGKILIRDLDTRARQVMRWIGRDPIYLVTGTNGAELSLTPQDNAIEYNYGEDIGFIYTDLIYSPGELTGDAGNSICDILDKIRDRLGNFEYFYDLDGNFIFQEKKNYLNTTYSSTVLNELNNSSKDYIVNLNQTGSVFDFSDGTLITSYSNSPQLNMIKNDFIVWGLQDEKYPIRYHLAIDSTPMVGQEHTVIQFDTEQLNDDFQECRKPLIVDALPAIENAIAGILYATPAGDSNYNLYTFAEEEYQELGQAPLQTIVTKDWRTELYLQGVDDELIGSDTNYYFNELKAEWPAIQDITGGDKIKDTISKNPSLCKYYLDIIDGEHSALKDFSVQSIGRRSKVVVDNNVNCVFSPIIPDYIIIQTGTATTEQERHEAEANGQPFIQVNDSIYSNLAVGGIYSNSAYDAVRDLLYQYTSYNESISIQAIPVPHLEPNHIVTVNDDDSNIHGEYILNSLSIPFDASGTMTCSAVKALTRI